MIQYVQLIHFFKEGFNDIKTTFSCSITHIWTAFSWYCFCGCFIWKWLQLVFYLYICACISIIFIFLFSITKNSPKRENKFYAIISLISFFLFTYITFGPYFGFTGFIAVPTLLYALVAYIYYLLRNKYNQTHHVILIDALYMIIKVGLIFTLIVATGLMGLGV